MEHFVTFKCLFTDIQIDQTIYSSQCFSLECLCDWKLNSNKKHSCVGFNTYCNFSNLFPKKSMNGPSAHAMKQWLSTLSSLSLPSQLIPSVKLFHPFNLLSSFQATDTAPVLWRHKWTVEISSPIWWCEVLYQSNVLLLSHVKHLKEHHKNFRSPFTSLSH